MNSYLLSELNYCEKNPDTCKNGGKCQSLETGDGSYRCHCQEGISGKHCEILPESMTTSNNTEVIDTDEITEKPESISVEETTTSKIEEDLSDDNETE